MADGDYPTPLLFAYLEPDTGPGEQHPNPDTVELGAGFLVVGAEIEGVRVPLLRLKAGGFLDDIARLKSADNGTTGKSG